MKLDSRRRQRLLADIRNSPTYLRAYEDLDFLSRRELRPVRFQLELLKPEMVLTEEHIRSTIVVFGSARLPAPELARAKAAELKRRLSRSPRDRVLKSEYEAALRAQALSKYYDEARKFAALVSKRHQRDSRREYVIVTGGGPGIMEAANRGAWEAGAKSIGLNITLPQEQDPNPYITPQLCFRFHYFALRKMHFVMRAKALVVFPGGYGTMDELFELLTLVQTGKKSRIPIVLVGREFWRRAVDFEYLASCGMISRRESRLFRCVETAQEAWEHIRRQWARRR